MMSPCMTFQLVHTDTAHWSRADHPTPTTRRQRGWCWPTSRLCTFTFVTNNAAASELKLRLRDFVYPVVFINCIFSIFSLSSLPPYAHTLKVDVYILEPDGFLHLMQAMHQQACFGSFTLGLLQRVPPAFWQVGTHVDYNILFQVQQLQPTNQSKAFKLFSLLAQLT